MGDCANFVSELHSHLLEIFLLLSVCQCLVELQYEWTYIGLCTLELQRTSVFFPAERCGGSLAYPKGCVSCWCIVAKCLNKRQLDQFSHFLRSSRQSVIEHAGTCSTP